MCCEGAGGAKACQYWLGCKSPADCSLVNKSGSASPRLCCPPGLPGARCTPHGLPALGGRGAASASAFRSLRKSLQKSLVLHQCFLPRWTSVNPRGSSLR